MKISIIGTGWGARVQVPAFRAAGLEVVALAGSDAAKTARIAGELGVPNAYGNWRAALDAADLVSIVTPPNLHLEMATAALAAGRHVLAEKPTALNLDEARAMLAAARQSPSQLALIDHELRFLPSFILARQLIADGAIGAVRHVMGLILGGGRSDPARAWNWWSDAAQGGGLLGAVGSHHIDMLRYLLSGEVTAISALLSTYIAERPDSSGAPRPVTADDGYSLRLDYQTPHGDGGEVTASLESNLALRLDEPDSLTIYGTEGTLRLSTGRLYRAPAGGALEEITPPHSVPIPETITGAFPVGTVYIGHALKAFAAGETEAAAPGATFLDGARIQAALDAARQSNALAGALVSPQAVS